jgi:sulfate permease, SulP family
MDRSKEEEPAAGARNMLFASAMREVVAEGYGLDRLRRDVAAGFTLGVIAIPLGMALSIAAGVPPQHGLYTVAIAGLVAALAGGSRFNVSGPTAAFVAVLLPVVAAHGIGGLLVATVMAGGMLVALGVARMGRFIHLIPYPVVIGFTSGIGVLIATLQVKDFFGLTVVGGGAHFPETVGALAGAFATIRWEDSVIGASVLATMIGWGRLRSRVPAHLVGLVVGTLLALALDALLPGFEVATIDSRFEFHIEGVSGTGIPPRPPRFVWPWELAGPDGAPVGISLALLRDLLPPAFAIALLGAIESLLCAVVADGFTGTRHNPNAELVGQGLANIVAPFFGGITATAAIARTAASIRAGATSPIAAVVHALAVLLSIVLFAPVFSRVPMAALAALLMVVAWHMAEVNHFMHIVRVAPRSDVAVLLTCFILTVLFDMVLAVGVGVGLAAVLFIRRMIEISGVELVPTTTHGRLSGLPKHVIVYDIDGPLFFGAARQALENLRFADAGLRVVVLDMSDVSAIDMTGLVAFEGLLERMRKRGLEVVVCGLPERLVKRLAKAGIVEKPGVLTWVRDYEGVVAHLHDDGT